MIRFQPKCHVWSLANPATHGTINLMQAIALFLQLLLLRGRPSDLQQLYEGDRRQTRSTSMAQGPRPWRVARASELPEAGTRAQRRDERTSMYAGEDAGWYGADVLQAVIGQSLNKFTPVQLACYTSALANKGTRYEATLLSRVVSWDYQDLIRGACADRRQHARDLRDEALRLLLDQACA
ncbi:MAG: hypothetical protein ACLU3I_00525 [Acutalibacteraceae bacterium]